MDRFRRLVTRLVRSGKTWIAKYPELTLAVAVAAMFASIFLSNQLRGSQLQAPVAQPPVKQVDLYRTGSSPKMTLSGKVEKLNVITISAQTPGIVSAIKVKEGAAVKKGQSILALASSYSGGNTASVARQISQKQLEQAEAAYPLQKELIAKQRETAETSLDNAEALRDIGQQSLAETRDQLAFSESILTTIDANLSDLETATASAQTDALLLSTRQLRSQYLAAVNQLRQAVRSTEYQQSGDEPPARLTELQRDIALKQLDVQEKSLEVGKEIAALNVRLSRITESLYYPASPFAGKVERVHIRLGQQVNPGTPLITLSGSAAHTQVVVTADPGVAARISRIEPSTLRIDSVDYTLSPTYISTEPTQGNLSTIIYALPVEAAVKLADQQFISLQVPVGYPKTGNANPFIPIDAIYQTQDQAYVYLAVDGVATANPITLGQVYGSFVSVAGLPADVDIITTRTVLAGDPVTGRQ